MLNYIEYALRNNQIYFGRLSLKDFHCILLGDSNCNLSTLSKVQVDLIDIKFYIIVRVYFIEKKRLRGRNRILLLNKCLATFHSSNFDHHQPCRYRYSSSGAAYTCTGTANGDQSCYHGINQLHKQIISVTNAINFQKS